MELLCLAVFLILLVGVVILLDIHGEELEKKVGGDLTLKEYGRIMKEEWNKTTWIGRLTYVPLMAVLGLGAFFVLWCEKHRKKVISRTVSGFTWLIFRKGRQG